MVVAAMILGGASFILFDFANPQWDATIAGVLATLCVLALIYLIF
jgi:hypothetical protein